MKRILTASALALVAISFLTAQTPAPASPPAKPMRHLEYAFSADYEGLYGGHDSSAGGGALPIGTPGSWSGGGGR